MSKHDLALTLSAVAVLATMLSGIVVGDKTAVAIAAAAIFLGLAHLTKKTTVNIYIKTEEE
jgi:hypothetical protein